MAKKPFGVEVTVRQSGSPDRIVALKLGTTRMGRSDDNDLVLPDVGVSRRHLQVVVDAEGATVEDLGSGNGTYLGGRRIQSQRLRDGDEVSIDPFTLRFRLEGGTRVRRVVQRPRGWLEIVQGHGTTARYPVDDEGAVIGRSEEAEVVLADPAASRQHARIDVRGGATTLKDLGSANGVFVNGARVRERMLVHGDVVRIGNSDLRWLLLDGPPSDRSMIDAPSLVPAAPSAVPAPVTAPREAQGGVWMAAIAGVTAVAVFVIAAATVGLGGLLWWRYAATEVAPLRAPPWEMRLPAGLPASSTRSLFDHGVDRMRAGAYKDGVEDFYRVLLVDPTNADARKFAVAASELLALEALSAVVEARATEMQTDAARRDAFLARGDRTSRSALFATWGEDPVVIGAIGQSERSRNWSDAMIAAERLRTAGDPGARAAWTALLKSRDLQQRTAARSALATLDTEQATRNRAAWEAAARLEAARDPGAAAAWRNLATQDPADVSARHHLSRIGG